MRHEWSCEAAPERSLGRQPEVPVDNHNSSPEGTTEAMLVTLLPPLRGSENEASIGPWAYAQGYRLPSLRDSRQTRKPS